MAGDFSLAELTPGILRLAIGCEGQEKAITDNVT